MAFKSKKESRQKVPKGPSRKGIKRKGPLLVIDIGSYNLSFLVGVQAANGIKITSAFTEKTPVDSYVNGKIKDVNSLTKAIKGALAAHNITVKDTILTFSSTDIIQREMTVPKLSYEDTIGMIRYDISQYLPINVDDYDVNFIIISSVLEEGVEKYNVLAFVVRKDTIDEFYDMLKACGLNPVALDIHSNSIAKFHNFVRTNGTVTGNFLDSDDNNEVYAFVDIGYNNMLVDIIKGSTISLSRTIDYGFYDQDAMISSAFGITIEEAEKFRREKISDEISSLKDLYNELKFADLDTDEIDKSDLKIGNGLMTEEEKVLFTIMRDSIRQYDEMASEISKVLQYFLSRNKNNRIDKVLFHGSSANNKNLINYLSDILQYDAKSVGFDNINSISFPANVDNKLGFCYAIGALIRRKEV